MNYPRDVTLLLSPAAVTRMDDAARDVLRASVWRGFTP